MNGRSLARMRNAVPLAKRLTARRMRAPVTGLEASRLKQILGWVPEGPVVSPRADGWGNRTGGGGPTARGAATRVPRLTEPRGSGARERGHTPRRGPGSLRGPARAPGASPDVRARRAAAARGAVRAGRRSPGRRHDRRDQAPGD